ncbi:hypothetical protein OY671_003204 [Metschnikowia pulcherrima]|nr:hypothetical protein OY671_003204 [Metschnikowia pulcherrima]
MPEGLSFARTIFSTPTTQSHDAMGLISFAEDTEPDRLEDKLRWKEKAAVAAEPKPERKAKEPAFQKDDVTSLSFEQVNDNADELIELRGAGRYFGVTDPSTGDAINASQGLGPLCDNCHKRGHVRAKCKTVICHKCGVKDDHYETQCPTTIVCSRCGERGHTWAMCTSKKRKQQYCKSCDSHTHSDDNCPSIWRSYLTITCKAGAKLPPSYCYNCGDDFHYGDECPEQRTSRIPNSNGSAFSGNNLPQELRNRYFDKCFGKKTKGFSDNSSRNFSSENGYGNNSYSNSYNNYNDSYNDNYNSYNNGYSNGYGKNYNSGYSNSYNSGYSNNSGNKNTGGGSKKKSSQSAYTPSSKNYEPSRSGYLASKTNGKKAKTGGKSVQASRSGVLPSKHKVTKPNRSGVVSKGKKGKGGMQQFY